tara:strand:- start:223 stop:480 length:258 start_codon:yes stop_codon:yes gene_type:complete
MTVIPRGDYNPEIDIVEGDLVTVNWDESNDLGIVLKVALEVRNNDHLCPSEEFLVAEVYICGHVFVFDEDEITIIEKCNIHKTCI